MTRRKNQLFRYKPPLELVLKILNCFGLEDLDDRRCFNRVMLEDIDAVEHIEILKDELAIYYLPCKARNYLNQLTEKNIITLLRQLVKLYGYTLSSCEKYSRGVKHIIYQVIPITERKYIYQEYYNPQPRSAKIEFKEEKVVVNWD